MKTATKEQMVTEAKKRLQMLGLPYDDEPAVFLSVVTTKPSVLYKIEQMVESLNQHDSHLVYAVLVNDTSVGILVTYLTVGCYEDDWKKEFVLGETVDGMRTVTAYAFVLNATDELLSDWGTVGVGLVPGGIIRVW